MRYDQLIRLAAEKKPDVLIEIGTHRGKRAAALKEHCRQYYGFDLWDCGNDETDRIERNGKGRSSMKDAMRSLEGAKFELIAGNTRETLPKFVERGIKADFVFIDGGHSVETIQSDFDNVLKILNPGAVVVFDDYYDPEIEGFGCNQTVSRIRHVLGGGDVFGETMIRLAKYVHP